jgi:hypothetical protein
VKLFSRGLFLSAALFTGVVVAACAKDSEPEANNGVNDVRLACEVRAKWMHAGAEKCINCMTAAPAPACDCEAFKEFGALCELQEAERHADPGCTSALDDCTRACPKTDCACVEGCYSQVARCKQLSGARDGCVAAVCAQYCE